MVFKRNIQAQCNPNYRLLKHRARYEIESTIWDSSHRPSYTLKGFEWNQLFDSQWFITGFKAWIVYKWRNRREPTFWYHELKHRLTYLCRTKLNTPKSPLHVYNTIVTFGIGLENFNFVKGRYIRKKVKNVKIKSPQQSRGQKTKSIGATSDPINSTAEVGQVKPAESNSNEGKKEA